MNRSLRWKLILSFALVFLAGGACGFFSALHSGAAFFGHPRRGSIAEHMKQHLRTELKLSSEQVQQISPIIDRATAQLEARRQQTSREVHAIFEETHREIAPFLSPEQRARLERMEQRHRQMMRRRGFMPPPP